MLWNNSLPVKEHLWKKVVRPGIIVMFKSKKWSEANINSKPEFRSSLLLHTNSQHWNALRVQDTFVPSSWVQLWSIVKQTTKTCNVSCNHSLGIDWWWKSNMHPFKEKKLNQTLLMFLFRKEKNYSEIYALQLIRFGRLFRRILTIFILSLLSKSSKAYYAM